MLIEHVAWQVPDPPATAAWFAEHLGFTIVRQQTAGAQTTFLADSGGRVMVEIYRNEAAPVPDYPNQHHLVLHLAMAVDDVAADRDRLLAAGATLDSQLETIPSGDQICMLRDPWGFPLQLVHRATPMVKA